MPEAQIILSQAVTHVGNCAKEQCLHHIAIFEAMA
ncbi:MAG: hypothetical protein ACLR2O_06410 [Coprococcus sp.]